MIVLGFKTPLVGPAQGQGAESLGCDWGTRWDTMSCRRREG